MEKSIEKFTLFENHFKKSQNCLKNWNFEKKKIILIKKNGLLKKWNFKKQKNKKKKHTPEF